MKGRGSEIVSAGDEPRGYDFHSPENAERWRGLFQQSLKKVLEQVHPTLQAEESALAYVEALCLRLLGMLCAVPSPLCVQDVEERVARTFPKPIDKLALAEARETVDRTKKKKLLMPTEKLHQLLQKEVLLYKIDFSVSVLIMAILEYICADILKLAGTYVKKISQKSGFFCITCQDIKTAMCADKVLMDMFYQDEELSVVGGNTPLPPPPPAEPPVRRTGGSGRRGSLTYAELVRDLLNDERHFLRELHLIIRVFKDEIDRTVRKQDVKLIFCNIMDIYELTVTLLGNLEDAMEMSQDLPTPYIGSCFEELADVEEFRAYASYASGVTQQISRDTLQRIVDDPEVSERLATAGHGFRLAVKYYLPKLLMSPIAHMFLYYDYVLELLQIAPSQEDSTNFKQVECNLLPIKNVLEQALKGGPKLDETQRMPTRARRQLAIEKSNELARLIDNWDSKELGQCCNEFIREDTLSKISPGKRISDRRAYLFDGLLVLCKPVTSLVNVGGTVGALGGVVAGGASSQLKLKEKLHLRKLDVLDRDDTDEYKHCIELAQRCGTSIVLACASAQDKRNWMSDLVMLNTKSMLDRTLDSILLDLEKKHPLKLPSPKIYKFAVEDSSNNIVLEESSNNHGAPLIKGATLLKLVERLTYHIYADLNFMRTFLTTYRSFCEPTALLDLLIERFNIPEPNLVYDTLETIDGVIVTDTEKLSKNTTREDWKRYRKEFLQPVKFRVINVLRHWVDQHFYDFERDPALLDKLKQFLESVDGKPMRKWVQSVLKTVQRKTQGQSETDNANSLTSIVAPPFQHVFDKAPPPVERHTVEFPERYDWNPLALSVVETARQLTLLEFDLYRTVKPSELVGAVWTKKDKEKTSPNLLRLTKHSTNLTRWLQKWILESENLEERAMVVRWVTELATAFIALNNFDGLFACVAAFDSTAVFRLKSTFQLLPPRLDRALQEHREMTKDHQAKYKERLRSINPPCVPFLGLYLTNILHIEEGNKDFLPDTELINFSKRRMVASITGEIQQYQNQPYCLTVEPKTRAFLESLNPFPGIDDKDVVDYLYHQSCKIEPRDTSKQLQKFPRRYPELSRKSPGVKTSRRHTSSGGHHQDNADDTTSVSQLSPTSVCGWDNTLSSSSHLGSVQSLQQDDDHRGSSIISPRQERSGSSTLRFGFFEKGTQRLASTMSLSRHSNSATSPSAREPESISPRLPSASISELSSRMLENFSQQRKSTAEPWNEQRVNFTHDAPPPRLDGEAEVRHQRIVSEIINGGVRPHAKPPALSPRNPIVDASVFYGTDNAALHHNFGEFGSPKRIANKNAPELSELRINKPPALSPKNVDRSTKPRCESVTLEDDVPPLLPRNEDLPPLLPRNSDEAPPILPRNVEETPPLLPRNADEVPPVVLRNSDDLPPLLPRNVEETPPLLPRNLEETVPPLLPRNNEEIPSLAVRNVDEIPPLLPRSVPVCEPPVSENVDVSIYGGKRESGQSSPERPPTPPERQPKEDRPLPSPFLDGLVRIPTMSPKRSPAPAPPHSPHVNVSPGASRNAFSFPTRAAPTPSPVTPNNSCSTPPPLPPRRRRDSTPAPPTPHNVVVPPAAGAPPPLPPRPTPAPELLRPAQSTILRRRYHNSTAPRLPPKPPTQPSHT